MKHTSFFATLVLLFSLATGFAYADQPTININSADAATLASLDGIGASKAEAIVAYRDTNGPFQTPEELSKVKGIGARTVEKNAERLTVK
ncbi:helix-hairpin-helix domain-containing protein [Marinobacter sp. 1-3A]|uniref:ComEA family DNA-binding protein n=1 Tax=unclassified Marinobacter TaxID=83889 RepID=UPI0019083F8D|nr:MULTISPECIES: helix-hairpin-helix domain-containing protein [unclassified Marinobacter]MBK1873628.1 helix-hairpin-helix domain-containing protein [Marinobacter sp. 1-3A]MBK1885156.1 helix-hairpin-helix domain-containing protein [Marinobacter sp. DY40_1A1]